MARPWAASSALRRCREAGHPGQVDVHPVGDPDAGERVAGADGFEPESCAVAPRTVATRSSVVQGRGRVIPAEGRVHEVEPCRRVDHEGDRRASTVVCGDGGDRLPVDAGIGDHHVVDPVVGQPARLGDRVREHTGERLVGQDGVQQGAHPYGLAREPDRQPTCPPYEIGLVLTQSHHVDDGERRVQRRGGAVQVGAGRHPRQPARCTCPSAGPLGKVVVQQVP
jgi:hypothetical protein